MFILKDQEGNLKVHLNATDLKETIIAGEVKVAKSGAILGNPNIRITLTPDKAKELEDRLEKTLKEA